MASPPVGHAVWRGLFLPSASSSPKAWCSPAPALPSSRLPRAPNEMANIEMLRRAPRKYKCNFLEKGSFRSTKEMKTLGNQRKVLDLLFRASWKSGQSNNLMTQGGEQHFPAYSETAMQNDQDRRLPSPEGTWSNGSHRTPKSHTKSGNLRQVKRMPSALLGEVKLTTVFLKSCHGDRGRQSLAFPSKPFSSWHY